MNLPKGKYWNTWDDSSFAGIKFIPAGFSVVIAGEQRTNIPEGEIGNVEIFDINPLDILFEHEIDGRYTRVSVMQGNAVLSIEYLKADDMTVLGRIKALDVPPDYILHLAMGFDGKEAFLKAEEENSLYGVRAISGARDDWNISVRLRNAPHEFLTNEAKIICSYKMIPGRTLDFTLSSSNTSETQTSHVQMQDLNEEVFPLAADLTADEAMKAFSELYDLRHKKLDARPILETSEFSNSLQRISDIKGWSDNYNVKAGLAYTSSAKICENPRTDWTGFLSDLSFQIMTNILCGDRFMADSTLEYLCAIVRGAIEPADAGIKDTETASNLYPPVLSYCLLESYYLSGDKSILQRIFPVLIESNRWFSTDRESITTLHCIDAEALAYIAAILGNDKIADEMNEKAFMLDKLYREKIRINKLGTIQAEEEKTMWDYLWLRREGLDLEARELADSAAAFVDDNKFSRTTLPEIIWLFEHFMIDPWNGISFGTTKDEQFVLDRIYTPLGMTRIVSSAFGTDVYAEGTLIFRANFRGRFSGFVFSRDYRAVVLDNKDTEYGVINFMPFKSDSYSSDSASVTINVSTGKYKVEVRNDGGEASVNVIPL